MFEVLANAVEEVNIPVDSAALTEVLRLKDRLDAKITMAVAAFDDADVWDVDGDTSMTAWLRHHAGMSNRDAAGMAKTGKRLRAAPVTAAAWVQGDLSGGQVTAVVANLNDDRADLWAQHETTVVPQIVPLPVHHVATVMAVWAEG